MMIDTIFSLMKNPWVAALLLAIAGLLGISVQSSRLKKAKQKVEDEKAHAEYEKRLRQQQQQVVAEAERSKDEFAAKKDEAVSEVVPEIGKVKDIPQEERKELSEPVKAAAKAQVERINKRRAKK
jgi:xanthosine utilization system XapX-like protein